MYDLGGAIPDGLGGASFRKAEKFENCLRAFLVDVEVFDRTTRGTCFTAKDVVGKLDMHRLSKPLARARVTRVVDIFYRFGRLDGNLTCVRAISTLIQALVPLVAGILHSLQIHTSLLELEELGDDVSCWLCIGHPVQW